MNRADFQRTHPGVFFLDPREPDALAEVLERLKALAPGEEVRTVAPAGPGNMNCVVRVTTSLGSLIVKQSRPWVERYPQFPAPWDRALRELEFYRLTAGAPGVAERMPRLRCADEAARLLVLDDLGPGADFTDIYGDGPPLGGRTIDELAGFLSALHSLFDDRPRPFDLPNREMRDLNASHIFFLPLRTDNGLDLDAVQHGLTEAASPLKADLRLIAEVERLGREVYLVDGPHLVHGDVFPGSLLRSPEGLKVIDPEFAFFGRTEFDLAVFVAHLALAGQPEELTERFLEPRRRNPGDWDEHLLWQLAGVEIIRRLLGYAQLPLTRTVSWKEALLKRARSWVLEGNPAS